jgi:hypothetical protein
MRDGLVESRHQHHLFETYLVVVMIKMKNSLPGIKQQSLARLEI